ncbi:tyrosine-type recombinase/integrase [Leeuwenhoekiella sp. MAR_2009_132]|uniref:tyrosine-type recombinase/integrase n=1 Tax=Leeuwenhoekiella sp. MAR_2009_132 TaxID=1392489 RepID=UPI00131F0640|nr:tyrosine-type recombinase/integrase [Leeuwenhoekiella sp. MAR_2009_132]
MNIRKWLDLYSRDCKLKYNSESTRNTYTACVKKFLLHFKDEVEPKSISNSKIKDWLLTFQTLNTRKQMLCSINSFYKLTVGMPVKLSKIPYPKKANQLPQVIDKDFLKETIPLIQNLKHRAILTLAYSTGLRVSEVVNLKIKHIESKRGLILVKNAKGNKDRYVPLSETVLQTLREYFKAHQPKEYLFNGQNSLKYSSTSCNVIVKKYLGNNYHFHQLRHSCFTSMLESGTDIRIIQKVAGHKSSKTTEIYTHISNQFLSQVNTPL